MVGGAEAPIPLTVKLDWIARVTGMVGVVSVLLVGCGLYLTHQATSAQQRLTIQSQFSERFGSAIEQLGQEGDDKLSIRLGGIYALERLMHDFPNQAPTVIEALSAFVRTHAARPKTVPKTVPPSPPDVRAAVVALSRRPRPDDEDNQRLNLTGTLLGLSGVDLRGGKLRDVDLTGADLTGGGPARRGPASCTPVGKARLYSSDLSSANLHRAELINVGLGFADLHFAFLGGVVLSGAYLGGSQLHGAYLGGSDLRGVNLSVVHGLTSRQLASAQIDLRTKLPKGVVQLSPAPFR